MNLNQKQVTISNLTTFFNAKNGSCGERIKQTNREFSREIKTLIYRISSATLLMAICKKKNSLKNIFPTFGLENYLTYSCAILTTGSIGWFSPRTIQTRSELYRLSLGSIITLTFSVLCNLDLLPADQLSVSLRNLFIPS